MLDLYWGCLIGGIVFALVMLVGGGLHHAHGFHHASHSHILRFLHPATVVGAITAFGGAGILVEHQTALVAPAAAAFAAAIALVVSVGVHFGYVRPMRSAENSLAFSVKDFAGRTGEVTISIPASGHGEVMVRLGPSNSCRIAVSFDGERIERGTPIVVVEVRDGILSVSPIDI